MAASYPEYIDNARPFLKWAGGKSQLLKQYGPYFIERKQIGRYYEPFLGSAAVFFYVQPATALLADVNDKLVEIYRVVQSNVEELIHALGRYENSADMYYQVRSEDPETLDSLGRAARLLFLNKTCYNGLYRENKQGRFNVPFGRYKNPTICDPQRLRKASKVLQGVDLKVADFEKATETAGPGDFVYLDPPYAPTSPTSNFTSYNRSGFSQDDQRRLAETIVRLTSRNCNVMLSNSDTPLVHQLYDGRGYRQVKVRARRSINSKADGRGLVNELLILNY